MASVSDRSPRTPPWAMAYALALLVVLGLALRLYRIDTQETGAEEMRHILWAELSLGAYFETVEALETTHLPGYALWLKAFLYAFGHGETVYRLSALVPNLVAILALFGLGAHLLGRRAGWVAALLFTIAPASIHVAQDTGPYSLVILFAILNAWSFYWAWTTERWGPWLVFACCGAISLYIHLFLSFMLLALAILCAGDLIRHVLQERNLRQFVRRLLRPAGAAALMVMLFLPVTPHVLRSLSPDRTEQWSRGFRIPFGEALLAVPRFHVFDRPESLAIFAVLVLLGTAFVPRRPRGWLVAAAPVLVYPLALYMMTGSQGHYFAMRHYFFALPFVMLLCACGLVKLQDGIAARLPGKLPMKHLGMSTVLVLLIAGPSATASAYRYYLTRGTQADFQAYRHGGYLPSADAEPPLFKAVYKTGRPELREVTSLLMRNMKPGDILVLDVMLPGDRVGRGLTFFLNRQYGLGLPEEEFFSTPTTMVYDPDRITVMAVAMGAKPYLASLENTALPERGVRVYRASQRCPVGEVPDTVSLRFNRLHFGISTETFHEREVLSAYLESHARFCGACRTAWGAEAAMKRGARDEAERLLRESVAQAMNSSAARQLARLLLEQGKKEEARPFLEYVARWQEIDATAR